MIHPFIGRKRELHILSNLMKKKAPSLVVIRGRRRIGKSRLVQEFAKKMAYYAFSGLPPAKDTTAKDQREEFARQLHQELKIPLPRADDWGDLFWTLAQGAQQGRIVILLDEISWMGSLDPLFLSKLKIAWDLYFTKNPQLILVLCGSISSWIEENILSSTGFFGRIPLDIVLEELPLPDCNAFWNAEGNRVSAADKFKVLAVTGGVPYYLEQILPQQSAEDNIQRLCFEKEGLLFSEFERIFSELFTKRNAIYKQIVHRLAEGPCELKEIYRAMKRSKSGTISRYLKDLSLAGFTEQDFTWHMKNGEESKLSQYRLRDNYLRFYLKYIEPNKKKIERGSIRLPLQWHSVLGLQFENLVLNNRKSIYKLLNIDPADIVYDNPYFQRQTAHSRGCQIDYMIQNRFGTCYVCEIKFTQSKISSAVIEEVKQKLKTLTLPRNISFRPVLIHVNGIEDAVEESGFFSSIIDFSQLLTLSADK